MKLFKNLIWTCFVVGIMIIVGKIGWDIITDLYLTIPHTNENQPMKPYYYEHMNIWFQIGLGLVFLGIEVGLAILWGSNLNTTIEIK